MAGLPAGDTRGLDTGGLLTGAGRDTPVDEDSTEGLLVDTNSDGLLADRGVGVDIEGLFEATTDVGNEGLFSAVATGSLLAVGVAI